MEGGCAPRFLKRCRLSTARVLIIQGDTERQELPINQFNAEILVPELRAAAQRQTYTAFRPARCARRIQGDRLLLPEAPAAQAAPDECRPFDAHAGKDILVDARAQ